MLSASILTMLNAQYNSETANGVAYAMLQSWSEMRGLNGAAAFFRNQSADEFGHASEVLKYIHSRNEQLTSCNVQCATVSPVDYADLFTIAQTIERTTTEQVFAIKAQAEAEGDHATCAWLQQPGGLILEQVEEENTIQTILDRITARGEIGYGQAVHDIDCWIAKAFG